MFFYKKEVNIDVKNPVLDKLFACTTYTKTGSDFIRTYKFGCAYALAPTISEMMFEQMDKPTVDLLISVPLHKSRQRVRGFNQAGLIAQQLAKRWKILYVDALKREKATTPQAQLNRAQRLIHLQDAFAIMSPGMAKSLQGKIVGIIDDVATTGTTLNECAKLLKKYGVTKVVGLVFAHGE